MTNQAEKIIQFLLAKVSKHPNDIVGVATKHFRVTRTTVHRHLFKLISDGKIVKAGTTRDIHYYLSTELNRSHSYKIQRTLSEFDVFKQDFEPLLVSFHKNIYDVFHYAFTEIFNNAIEHSFGTKIVVTFSVEKNTIVLVIDDNGIGIFKSLYNYFELDDLREGALQLSKGKMTTDPANHTGEGIFFTSRAMDTFEIFANNLHYIKNNAENDWGMETLSTKMVGSRVIMTLSKDSTRDLSSVFMKYQNADSLAFDRTEIFVEMAKWGDETLVSRSQAKRIVRGLEKFKKVTLDFKGIRLIGQGFVDEVFRVFQNKFPGIEISYINANGDVEFMIKRGTGSVS